METEDFVAEFRNDPRKHLAVIDWLSRNPPPQRWSGTTTEWAYLEMPLPLWWQWERFKNWIGEK